MSNDNTADKTGKANDPQQDESHQGTDQLDSKEEKSKKEKVTMDDLRGKKVDAFPDTPEDQPIEQKKK